MNEQILAGKKYRVLADEATGLWNRISFWNKASDTELESGKTVEEAFADVPGLSDTFTPGAAIPRDADTLGGQYSASDITTLTNNLNNLKDNYNKHEFGTRVDLSSYTSSSNQYTFPSDGYIKISVVSNAYCVYCLNDITSIINGASSHSGSIILFVKKGMKAYIDRGSIDEFYFYPLV